MDLALGCGIPPSITEPTVPAASSSPPQLQYPVDSLFSLFMRAGHLQIRDAIPSDADAYVRYWHYSGDEIKDQIGIDPQKLGTPEDSRKRFLQMIRVPGADQPNVVFTITLNNEVIGYSNMNRHGPDDNYAHLHTYRRAVRAALRKRTSTTEDATGSALGGVLIGLIGGYFELFPIRRLILETKTANRSINSALDLYMPPAETKYVDSPGGLAGPGEKHLRYVYREDVPWILRRCAELRKEVQTRSSIRISEPSLLAHSTN